ncbi:MAG: hypothetical protein BWK80_62715 [Desulfobacteraceae bacterium IS3]|nr:MAG: hypothetical protein BWK80_62715 [Desulfobacteraceae bacterium IS3]HAO23486.1 hypothetical protein [Desulfobacteraceae bacterium]
MNFMLDTLPGLILERTIPPDVIGGLMSGQYKIYGGVVRWAAGTENAGQIVRHLIPVSSTSDVASYLNIYQLQQLSGQVSNLTQATQHILQIANYTMVLSGLSLAVSAIGFFYLNKKLSNLEIKLTEIQNTVYEIRALLEISERAELRAALRDLMKIDDSASYENRHTILHNTRLSLARINEKYRELLSGANTIDSAMAYEELFSLTALTQCRCTAELGMLDIAHQEIKEMRDFWKKEAVRITNQCFLGSQPERFISKDFAKDIPIAMLAEWLDFANQEEKGYFWIDELRAKTDSWYLANERPDKPSKRLFGLFSNDNTSIDELNRQRKDVVPSIQKIVARDKVFEGHVAQYEFMKKYTIKPSELERRTAAIAQSSSIEGYLILRPEFV